RVPPPGRPGRRRQRLGCGPRPDGDLAVARDYGGLLARKSAPEHHDRAPDARPPELRALLDRGHAERRGPRFDEGARRRDRAVAVPVGLDDGEHLHPRTDELPGGAEIRAQRPEAHLGDRGPTLDVVHTQLVGGNLSHIKWADKVRAAEALAAAEARDVVPG